MRYLRRTGLILITITLLANGCILERIFRVQRQLCDFEQNFQIDTSQGFRVILREPIMLNDDITWLAGAEPTEQELIGNELVMTYTAERTGMPSIRKYDLPIELRFVRLNGKYRLKQGYLSKNLTDILTDELLSQIMQSVCKSEKSLAKQQIVVDIGSLDRNLLPARSKIVEVLGPSNSDSSTASKLNYDYQLKNHDINDLKTTIEIDFDEVDDRILRIKVKYLRYHLDVDIEKGKAVLKVDIFLDEQT